ncbi:hypothetical protein BC936DRAFT_143428 [Jimgerdemannia flammicorona]|uniref:Uncharacterized protein n=1 Tax=Jimgerdemannia flammicorona TaxID=994334 RepID=A0A432ZZF0_9FUNG|nr:hypothetical protein BC936DRAFT_143428 [Jimgerdemannia flammicorona]
MSGTKDITKVAADTVLPLLIDLKAPRASQSRAMAENDRSPPPWLPLRSGARLLTYILEADHR